MSSFIVTYIRRERRSWGLSQQDLAVLLGIKSRSQISALEQGTVRPTALQLVMLQCIFGLTPRQLFPQLDEEARAHVANVVQSLNAAMPPDTTLRTQRKTTLLRQISARAVSS
jgi:transcriptional regulator with XRE-family HTH domain